MTIIATEDQSKKLTDESGAFWLTDDLVTINTVWTMQLPVNCVLMGQQREPGRLDSNNNPMALKMIFGE